jgi:putative membrane protein
MHLVALALTALVALLHGYFLILEMFLWQRPLGLKTFAMDAARAETTSVLAKNQGLYNGFLAAGLLWALAHPDAGMQAQLLRFFLGCVIVAGAYGGMTVNKRIFFIQAVPAIVALVLASVG